MPRFLLLAAVVLCLVLPAPTAFAQASDDSLLSLLVDYYHFSRAHLKTPDEELDRLRKERFDSLTGAPIRFRLIPGTVSYHAEASDQIPPDASVCAAQAPGGELTGPFPELDSFESTPLFEHLSVIVVSRTNRLATRVDTQDLIDITGLVREVSHDQPEHLSIVIEATSFRIVGTTAAFISYEDLGVNPAENQLRVGDSVPLGASLVKPSDRLRSRLTSLSEREIKEMCERHGFYDGYWMSSRRWRNEFVLSVIESEAVVHDASTGRMWHPGGSGEALSFDDAREWLARLNHRGYAGFHDWRVPTLEELASLVESRRLDSTDCYAGPLFQHHEVVWSGDRVSRLQRKKGDPINHWAVDFLRPGFVATSPDRPGLYEVKPVRTASGQ